MSDTLLTAILTLITTVITILGALATQYLNQRVKDSKDRELGHALIDAATNAVKATAQTITSKQRTEGTLTESVKQAARQSALEQTKILLGDRRLKEATEKYGVGQLDKTLITLLEAAVHDCKHAPPNDGKH
jgi:hypothetical protein